MNSRRLKKAEDFVPCPEEENDELYPNGFFVFNITHLLRFLHSEDSTIPITTARVADFPRFSNGLDQNYVDSTDLSRPIIVAEIAPERYNVIDGNHRMEKARKSDVATLPCYRVPPTVHSRFLTSQRAYEAYIDYWNEKFVG